MDDPVAKVKSGIESLIGLSGSDADAFWALSKKCSLISVAPAVAGGAKWGPGLIAVGTVTIPGVGTISGYTATVLLMGGIWTGSYLSCMSLLPELDKFKKSLQMDQAKLMTVRREVSHLVSQQRMTPAEA